MALIVLFGRTGIVTTLLWEWFAIPRSRWIYGLPGVLLAQVLAQAPIAFLLLDGALRAISPSLEEASSTMGARRFTVFRTVTWPLLRPALAAAFLLGFVESLADFGNPLVLGGDFDVLSTRIFFAIAGARHDPGRAAALALLLLLLTFGAFALQALWLGKRRYTTVTGKGDSGLPAPLPKGLKFTAAAIVWPWIIFTAVVYGIILVGGFVHDIGRGDMSFTWRHLTTAFEVEWQDGMALRGSAWDSLLTTLEVAAISAPLTAGLGILLAWLIARQEFRGRRLLEFMTMLSFAIPGTVVGVSYIMAFNVPPVELTGTALILILCFVFRNLPVGVRGGIAALAQIDRSLDEASATMGASAVQTLRRVVLPLMRPAIITALAFSFVHAMTAVSAVIFLVSARHNLATVYIVGRVEAGEMALAIAYSTVLILIMLVVVLGIEKLVGRAEMARRAAGAPAPAPIRAGA
jgi:iron(III) transport system permease protein